MLDKLLDPRLLRMKPVYAVGMGFFFVLLGFISSYLIFSSQVSLVMIAFSSLLVLPYVVKIFEFDELDVDIDATNREELLQWCRKCLRDGFSPKQIKDNLIRDNIDKPYDLVFDLGVVDEEELKYMKASNVYSRHAQTIQFYCFLFLGMFLGYALLFGVLSPEAGRIVFRNQLDVLVPGPRGYFANPGLFVGIVGNNLAIVLVCTVLSLLYGSGAIFILNYNASIAGVLYGKALRGLLGAGVGLYGNPILYIPHTVLEILAYLLAAIAGGIFSKNVVDQQPGSQRILLRDAGLLLAFSIILVLVAGYVEVLVIEAM